MMPRYNLLDASNAAPHPELNQGQPFILLNSPIVRNGKPPKGVNLCPDVLRIALMAEAVDINVMSPESKSRYCGRFNPRCAQGPCCFTACICVRDWFRKELEEMRFKSGEVSGTTAGAKLHDFFNLSPEEQWRVKHQVNDLSSRGLNTHGIYAMPFYRRLLKVRERVNDQGHDAVKWAGDFLAEFERTVSGSGGYPDIVCPYAPK